MHGACVIGAKGEYRGETVKAVVVLPAEVRATAKLEDIIAWAREHMAAYQVPKVVEFVNHLPKAGSGKEQAVLILCAGAHGEWVRMHPFPNCNGRTARTLVNSIAQRYGLPAFMHIRPRPGARYQWVASQAMLGDWASYISLFAGLYEAALGD